MTTKTVYSYDLSGMYLGTTAADESPMEAGVFLMPARTVEAAPPAEWPDGQWPRWNGSEWLLVMKPAANDNEPVAKMMAFLDANPDVAAYLAAKQRSV